MPLSFSLNTRADTPKDDWSIGDVRGVLEVNVPIGAALAKGQSLSNTITLILVAVSFVLCIALFFIYRKTIGSQLHGVAKVLENISHGEGDLTQRINDKRQDELGLIAFWFNSFISKLQSMMSNVGGSVNTLAASAEQLSQTSSEVSSAVEEINRNVTSINVGCDQSVAVTHQTMATSKELAQTATDLQLLVAQFQV